VYSLVAEALDHPMSRQNGQLLLLGLEEQHHHVLGRRVFLAGLVGPSLVAITERGLVAMMAVGDGDRRL
jgi:hypothetical protein